MPVSPVPSGYRTLTPYLIIDGAARAIAWYTQAFNAREVMRLASPGGGVGHAELHVPEVDTMIAQAAAAGATVKAPVEDKFYGDRMGTVVDPFGHTWHIATHIEDITVEEIERRMAAMFSADPSA